MRWSPGLLRQLIPASETRAGGASELSRRRRWVDSLRIYCLAGRGGNGYPTKGGLGGKGGDVILETEAKAPRSKTNKGHQDIPDLGEFFRKNLKADTKNQRLAAGRGGDAKQHLLLGVKGHDRVLTVPRGVVLTDDAGKVLYELNDHATKVIVARGGEGGGPANGFAGGPGDKRYLRINLKLLADVGLVGFPNAGKSTFLKAVSRAKPKIASYPFTTVRPNVGHVTFADEREMTVADLPGLIEGSHENLGMGHRFLKHVERTSMLLFIVDVDGFQLNPSAPQRSAVETVALLNRELELYHRDLLLKPAICLANKMDKEGAKEKFQELKEVLSGTEENYAEALRGLDPEQIPERRMTFESVLPMSAKFSKKSVLKVKEALRLCLDVNDGKIYPTLEDEPELKGPNIA